jgi:hypothetical protein
LQEAIMRWLSLGLIAVFLMVPAARGEPADDRPPDTATSAGQSAAPAPKPDEDAPKPRPAADRSREHSGRGGSREMPMGPGIFRDVTDQDISDILQFAQEHLPALHESLRQMQESDPARFRPLCRRLRFEIGQLKALKKTDEAAFQKALEEKRLQFLARNAADRLRAAQDPAERDRLRTQLREMVGKLFDAEQATREAHIRLLGKKLEEIRAELRERAAQRDAILDKRLEEMIQSDSGGPDRPPDHRPHEGPPKKPPAPDKAPKPAE